jgi:hypothetical protein
LKKKNQWQLVDMELLKERQEERHLLYPTAMMQQKCGRMEKELLNEE